LDYKIHYGDAQMDCQIQNYGILAGGKPMNSASPPVQTRLTAKGGRTRQRIVAAAAELMFEHGVASTTIDEVKAAATVSSSQLYHYFDDKNALVEAVIDLQTDTIVGNQERFHLDTLEGFRAWRDHVVALERRLHCRGGCPLGSLGSELAEIDPQARSRIAASFSRWEIVIQSGLRAMHARGQLVPDAKPDDLALATLAAFQGGLLLTQIQRDTKPLETALDTMITLIASLTIPSPGGSPPAA
jgi:TetR/AcrR family transcriptional regulator, transcriptional repressor for nem operon